MANLLTYKGLRYKTFKYEEQLNKEKVMIEENKHNHVCESCNFKSSGNEYLEMCPLCGDYLYDEE